MFMAADDADHSLAYQHNFAAVAAYPTDCLVGLDGGWGGVVERSVQDHIWLLFVPRWSKLNR
jgi:hypothetical protein